MCDTCDSKNAKIPVGRARVKRRIIGIFTLSFSVELPYRLDKSQGVRDRDIYILRMNIIPIVHQTNCFPI